jgi:uncharacterized YigZ family protein
MESDSYYTIKSVSEGIYKEKGSRFLACAFPISDIEEVRPIIEKIRKERHEARHHCFAYMIGKERTIWRANDDGEPSGTAGRPILGQINSSGLTNILIVVSRYFGGTLLGVSGLINAYRSAAASAIENAEIEECAVKKQFEITFPYSSMNDVMKIIKDEDLTQSDQVIDLECRITVSFSLSSEQGIRERLDRVKGLEYFHSENTN